MPEGVPIAVTADHSSVDFESYTKVTSNHPAVLALFSQKPLIPKARFCISVMYWFLRLLAIRAIISLLSGSRSHILALVSWSGVWL